MNANNSVFDVAVVNAALGDLAGAYELVSEIAKTSHGNSKGKQYATAALTQIETGFAALAHYGSPGTSARLKKKIDTARIIPEI